MQHWNVVRVTKVTGGKLEISGLFWFCGLRKSEISIGELVHDTHYSAARRHNIGTFCVDINAAKHSLFSSVIIQPGSPGASLPPSQYSFIDMLQIDQDTMQSRKKNAGRVGKVREKNKANGSWKKDPGWRNPNKRIERQKINEFGLHRIFSFSDQLSKKRVQIKWTKRE